MKAEAAASAFCVARMESAGRIVSLRNSTPVATRVLFRKLTTRERQVGCHRPADVATH